MQLACIALVIGPYYGLAILNGVQTMEGVSFELPAPQLLLTQALVLLILFGGLSLVLHRYVCGESLRTFQTGQGTIWQDIAEGFGLFAMLMTAVMLVNLTLWKIRGESYVSSAVGEIATALASDPAYVIVLLGPVVWLQAAVLEEVTRVFMLIRLWRAFPGPRAEILAVIFGALLFGLAHLYQGWEAIPAISAIGLLLGLYYQRRRRILPLVLAHGLFDTTVMLIAWFIATNYPEMLSSGAPP